MIWNAWVTAPFKQPESLMQSLQINMRMRAAVETFFLVVRGCIASTAPCSFTTQVIKVSGSSPPDKTRRKESAR